MVNVITAKYPGTGQFAVIFWSLEMAHLILISPYSSCDAKGKKMGVCFALHIS